MPVFTPNRQTREKYVVAAALGILFAAVGVLVPAFSILAAEGILLTLFAAIGFAWVSHFRYHVDDTGLTITRPLLGDIHYPADTLGTPRIRHSLLAGDHVSVPTEKHRFGKNRAILPAADSDGLRDALNTVAD